VVVVVVVVGGGMLLHIVDHRGEVRLDPLPRGARDGIAGGLAAGEARPGVRKNRTATAVAAACDHARRILPLPAATARFPPS